MPEEITLTADGQSFTGWESFLITMAINEAARAFELSVSEIPGSGPGGTQEGQFFDTWHFPPNTAIQISANGTLIVDGYVDDYEPSMDKESHNVKLSGRSKGADWVDISAVHPTGNFDNKKVEDIATELDVCSVGVSTDVNTGPPVAQFRIRQGSTPQAEVLRLCQQRKLVMKGKADGGVLLTRAGNDRHSGALAYGVGGNLKSMSGKLTARMRFSEYIAKGQSVDQLYDALSATAKDSKVPRYRPKVIIDQANTNNGLLLSRAEWEKARAAGNSARAMLITPSFRDSAGVIWEPAKLVYVDASPIKLKQDMVIEKVELFKNSDEGTGARISVVDPRTYAGEFVQDDNSPLYDQDEDG